MFDLFQLVQDTDKWIFIVRNTMHDAERLFPPINTETDIYKHNVVYPKSYKQRIRVIHSLTKPLILCSSKKRSCSDIITELGI